MGIVKRFIDTVLLIVTDTHHSLEQKNKVVTLHIFRVELLLADFSNSYCYESNLLTVAKTNYWLALLNIGF